jgi:lysophospholipase L1-like esterase
MISLQARLNHFPVINVAQTLRDIQNDDQAAFESLFEDMVHLNAKGREKVAGIIAGSIKLIRERAK